MRAILLALALLSITACRHARPEPTKLAAKDEATLRSPPAGKVVGGPGSHDTYAWLGIPFAKPPTGDLRWRAPEPLEPWSGVRDATQHGRPCSQYASLLIGVNNPEKNEIGGDESCLTLNVFAPKDLKEGERLPVMFWIHGGGNSIGSAERYDGGTLAAKERVIVVTTQYRLGPFGWFSHRGLRAGTADAKDQSGNFATLDLIQALRWTRDNISAFGGDPGNVTVFGESAGGFNTYSLLLSPEAKGLFHKAIAQSGAVKGWTKAQAENWSDDKEPGHKNSSNEVLARMLIADGQVKDRAEAKAKLSAMSDEDVGKYLRGKSPQDLLNGYEGSRAFGMLDGAFIIADGAVMPDGNWLERFADPNGWNKVPVILGTNRDEVKLFLFFDPKRVWKLFWFLPRYVDEPSYQVISTAISSAWKIAGADGPAGAMRRGGHPSVFGYRFDWDEEPTRLGTDLSGMLGAAHGLEIPFVFGNFGGGGFDLLFTDENLPGRQELSAAMMSYWANFAYTSSPAHGHRGELPEWSAWNEGQFQLLDTTSGGGIRMSSEVKSWEEIASYVKSAKELPENRHKCLLLYAAASWDPSSPRSRYESMGEGLCAEFPFAGHPWGEPP